MRLGKITLVSQQQGHAVIKDVLWPKCKEELGHGRALVLEVSYLDDVMTHAQRGYLHGCILTNISKQVSLNGEKFPMKVWKEWYRNEFLGFRTVTHRNPFNGRKSRRRERISTEDLGVRRTAEYIDRVIAHATDELGATFPEEWTDPETGEVFSLKDSRQRRAARERKKELGVEA